MRTKDITLSASLMAIYIAVKIITTVSPIKITGLMVSALFGLFWGYYSCKQNLIFASVIFYSKIVNSMGKVHYVQKFLSLEWEWGLKFIEYLNVTMNVPLEGIDYIILKEVSRGTTIINVFILNVLVKIVYCYVGPYLFYKYFKSIGVFRRLPSF